MSFLTLGFPLLISARLYTFLHTTGNKQLRVNFKNTETKESLVHQFVSQTKVEDDVGQKWVHFIADRTQQCRAPKCEFNFAQVTTPFQQFIGFFVQERHTQTKKTKKTKKKKNKKQKKKQKLSPHWQLGFPKDAYNGDLARSVNHYYSRTKPLKDLMRKGEVLHFEPEGCTGESDCDLMVVHSGRGDWSVAQEILPGFAEFSKAKTPQVCLIFKFLICFVSYL